MGNQMSLDKTIDMDSLSENTLIFHSNTCERYSAPSIDCEEFEILQRTPSMEDLIDVEDKIVQSGDLLNVLDKTTWQNPNSDILFLSESLVLRYLESVLHFMKLINEDWDLRLIKCGSYYEGLCTGLPIRFEYMLELTAVQVSELFKDESGSLDKVTARFCGVSKALGEDKGQEDYAEVIDQIMTCMRRYMHHNSYCNELQLLEVQDSMESPGFQLFLKHNGHGIIVTLTPAVKFPPYCRDILPQYSEATLKFIREVIPGLNTLEQAKEFITGTLHLVLWGPHGHFRISSAVLEMYIMKCLPDQYKQSFRVLQYLCQTHLVLPDSYQSNYLQRSVMLKLFGYKPFVPSYAIKLLFMHHIMQCYDSSTPSATPGMYFNDKTGLIQALIKDLKRLKLLIHLPLDCCAFMVDSILFGDAYKLRFDFVKRLLYSRISQNIGWFDQMINTMELILDEEITKKDEAEYQRRFKKLNYPTHTDVKFYPRFF